MPTWYGRTGGDLIATPSTETDPGRVGQLQLPTSATYTVWDSFTGGAQIGDLISTAGDPISVVTATADAQIGRPLFGRTATNAGSVYLQDSQGRRWLVHPIDLVERITTGGVGPAGPATEYRVSGGFIQYRSVGGTTWTDLIATADLKGAAGTPGTPGVPGPNGPIAPRTLRVFLAGEVANGISAIEPTIHEPHRILGAWLDIGTPASEHRIEADVRPNGVSIWNTTAARMDLDPTIKSGDFHPPDVGHDIDRGRTAYRLAITDSGVGGGVIAAPSLVAAYEGSSGASATTNFSPLDPAQTPGIPATIPVGTLIRVHAVGSNVLNLPTDGSYVARIADATTVATHVLVAERTATGTVADRGLFVSGDGTSAQSSPIAWVVELQQFAGDTVHLAAVSPGTAEVDALASPTLVNDTAEELASWTIAGRTDTGSQVTAVTPSGVTGTAEVGEISTTRTGATLTNFFIAVYSKALPTANTGGGSLTGTITTSPAAAGARMVAIASRTKRRAAGGTPGKDLVLNIQYQPLEDTTVPGGS